MDIKIIWKRTDEKGEQSKVPPPSQNPDLQIISWQTPQVQSNESQKWLLKKNTI